MKAHLLIFDAKQVDKDAFRDAIDSIESIENWTLFFGNAMCLASRQSARALSREIQAAVPRVRFLITTIDPTLKGGWLPRDLWQFMNKPTPISESADA